MVCTSYISYLKEQRPVAVQTPGRRPEHRHSNREPEHWHSNREPEHRHSNGAQFRPAGWLLADPVGYLIIPEKSGVKCIHCHTNEHRHSNREPEHWHSNREPEHRHSNGAQFRPAGWLLADPVGYLIIPEKSDVKCIHCHTKAYDIRKRFWSGPLSCCPP